MINRLIELETKSLLPLFLACQSQQLSSLSFLATDAIMKKSFLRSFQLPNIEKKVSGTILQELFLIIK